MGRETNENENDVSSESVLVSQNAADQFSHTNLTIEERVALMGRRTLGFAKNEQEDEERWCLNPYVFDNTYFQELIREKKYVRLADDENLVSNSETREFVEKFADDNEHFFTVFATAF